MFGQKARINSTALNNPNIDLSKLTASESLTLLKGITVRVSLNNSNEIIGTFPIDDKGCITFNFPDGMQDPSNGIFIFEIGPGQTWTNPYLDGVDRTLRAKFTQKTIRPFIYKIIFIVGTQNRGSFAVSGKSDA
jgi:hypothetical protein